MYSYQRQKSAKRSFGGYQTIELMREFLEEFDCSKGSAITQVTSGSGSAEETSLNSLGEGSSGYESFRNNRLEDTDDTVHNSSEENSGGGMVTVMTSGNGSRGGVMKEIWKISQNKCDSLTVYDIDLSEDLFTQGTVYLGENIISFY